jgi:hypothetical protein
MKGLKRHTHTHTHTHKSWQEVLSHSSASNFSGPYFIEVMAGNNQHTYRTSDRRLSAKLVPTSVDRGCRLVSATDPYGRILGFYRPESINMKT